ncbi:MAG: hypothetical protein M3452_03225 [Chloroflexota bacterium]|nr:hypothetical protein [Chloroflexota bacterium]
MCGIRARFGGSLAGRWAVHGGSRAQSVPHVHGRPYGTRPIDPELADGFACGIAHDVAAPDQRSLSDI